MTRRPAKNRPASLKQKLRKLALAGLLLALALPPLLVLPWRWVNPPISALMLLRLAEPNAGELRYRWVDAATLPKHVALAFVSAEDQRFFEHRGVDLKSLQQAIRDRWRGKGLRGASTITQQVAKNLFLWPGRSFVRKGVEIYFAIWVELFWPKQRTLEIYMNIVELGRGVYGVEAASQRFLAKPASKLAPRDAALLAAVLPNPRRLLVAKPSNYVRERQTQIYAEMQELRAYLSARGATLPGR